MTEQEKIETPDTSSYRIVEPRNPSGTDQIHCYLESGKHFTDSGKPKMGFIRLYPTNVWENQTEAKKFGSPTDKKIYRLNLGKYPSAGITLGGMLVLKKAIEELIAKYPIE